jgi:hypothetical protein
VPFSRIQLITHCEKKILFVDLANCTAREVEKLVQAVPDYLSSLPHGSALLLSDLSGASFDDEAVRAMQQAAVFDKPFIKKTAWIGADSFPQKYQENLKAFSRREFPAFKTRQEALDWLVKD